MTATANIDREALVGRILLAAQEYRIADYDRLVAEARAALDPLSLVRDVCSPVLREAGNRWHAGTLSIVQEHLLSSAIRRQLCHSLDQLNDTARGPAIAFTTLAGERHELGTLMLAVVAASRGFHSICLGPDLPVAEVGKFAERVAVTAVAISIVTHPDVIDAHHQLADLHAVLPDSVHLWLGGQATSLLRASELPGRCVVVRDLPEFESRLAALKAST